MSGADSGRLGTAADRASAQPLPCWFCGRPVEGTPMTSVDVRRDVAAYFQAFADAVHKRDSVAAAAAFVPLLRYASGAQPDRWREDPR